MKLNYPINPTPEEITTIVKQEIIKHGKRPDFDNFLLIFKKNKYSVYPYFKYINGYLRKCELDKNLILQLMFKLEIAENMLLEGATLREIKQQTEIPDELLFIIIKKYQKKIPQEVWEMKLMHFRLMQLTQNIHTFYKHILEKYTPADKKEFIENFYHTIIDMTMLDEEDTPYSELYTHILGTSDESI